MTLNSVHSEPRRHGKMLKSVQISIGRTKGGEMVTGRIQRCFDRHPWRVKSGGI